MSLPGIGLPSIGVPPLSFPFGIPGIPLPPGLRPNATLPSPNVTFGGNITGLPAEGPPVDLRRGLLGVNATEGLPQQTNVAPLSKSAPFTMDPQIAAALAGVSQSYRNNMHPRHSFFIRYICH